MAKCIFWEIGSFGNLSVIIINSIFFYDKNWISERADDFKSSCLEGTGHARGESTYNGLIPDSTPVLREDQCLQINVNYSYFFIFS